MNEDIIKTFETFQEMYTLRDKDNIDVFMMLFSDDDDVQMLGVGATVPDKYEWYRGKDEIKDIVLSDWTYWGAVHFDMSNIHITEKNDVAWFKLSATLEQLPPHDAAWEFYANQMKELLDKENVIAHDRIFEASHFGVRRLRERNLGIGYQYNMVLTGVLVKEGVWKFHTLHWSMPVE
ncbi:MAG: nuclear transport factor 2 family protein [Clostridiales bacterium]|nr:nuclear transport factor 2 family protein [Clostridiales bacterium]